MSSPFVHTTEDEFTWIELEILPGEGLNTTDCVYIKYGSEPAFRISLILVGSLLKSGKVDLPFTIPAKATYSVTPYNPDRLN